MDSPLNNNIDANEPGGAASHEDTTASISRATVGESSTRHQPHRWRPRTKSVSNACERCRRRKIRCDGDAGPCSTCVRFCVACVRPPKLKDRMGLGAHRALATRIQQLEAQLAEMGDAHCSPLRGEHLWRNCTPASTPRPAQPSLHVDTTFDQQQRSFSWDFSASPDHYYSTEGSGGGGSSSTAFQHHHQPTNIPTIEISEYCGGGGGPSSSPAALLSPAPSLLFSANNSRCSTPDHQPYAITTPPIMGGGGDGSYLSPPDHGQKPSSLSRRSSISSLGPDQDFNSINLRFSPSFDDDEQQQPPPSPGGFGMVDRFRWRHSDHSTTPPTGGARSPEATKTTPTKSEAETLSGIFFDRIAPGRRPVGQAFYRKCLDLVYEFADDDDDDDADREDPDDVVRWWCLITPYYYSLRMARFYVFMTMAVGVRLRGRSGSGGGGGRSRMSTTTDGDDALLDSCFRLAMRQAESPSFWCEAGAVEAASLLGLFAESGEVAQVLQVPAPADRMDP
ncbi:hypothetical protein SLS58_011306 [Diplodia intermedia]|uniref:Zn(2)-C6 fungal-type domain-containing protein n=1 Tax=Diplodia intermedia TaxID=856260 RepID=A0ABR3SZW9_9PEZI